MVREWGDAGRTGIPAPPGQCRLRADFSMDMVIEAPRMPGNAVPAGRPNAVPRRLRLLDPRECDVLAARVDGLAAHWIDRHPLAPFYTLGAAAYLDMPAGRALYETRAAAANPLLDDGFAACYARLCDGLGGLLGATVVLDPDPGHARPGFHVYRASPFFAFDVASVHTDRQYQLLDWPGGTLPGEDDVLTFTLPLRQPAGSGLRLWPDGPTQPSRQIDYRPGELIVHDGLTPHQAVLMPTAAGDRITLQGHAVRIGATWRVYW